MEYNLKNSRVLIKDIKKNQVIADTTIKTYDAHASILTVRVSSLVTPTEGKVSLLIFDNDRILEFEGILRRPVIANEVDIYLASGKEKEDRKHSRYTIRTKGIVSGIRFGKTMVSLRRPIEIETKNISATGVLLQAQAGSFEVGHRIQLTFRLNDTLFQNEYKVCGRKSMAAGWSDSAGERQSDGTWNIKTGTTGIFVGRTHTER